MGPLRHLQRMFKLSKASVNTSHRRSCSKCCRNAMWVVKKSLLAKYSEFWTRLAMGVWDEATYCRTSTSFFPHTISKQRGQVVQLSARPAHSICLHSRDPVKSHDPLQDTLWVLMPGNCCIGFIDAWRGRTPRCQPLSSLKKYDGMCTSEVRGYWTDLWLASISDKVPASPWMLLFNTSHDKCPKAEIWKSQLGSASTGFLWRHSAFVRECRLLKNGFQALSAARPQADGSYLWVQAVW